MAKSFANHFKRILKRQQSDNQIIVGTVLSVKPIKVSCYDGQWLLTADDLQISNTVMLTVGASVQLAGKNPYTIIGVLSDQNPDEYEPPAYDIDVATVDEIIDYIGNYAGGESGEDSNIATVDEIINYLDEIN